MKEPSAVEPEGEETLTISPDPPVGSVRERSANGTAQLVVLVGRGVGRRHPIASDQVIGRGAAADVHADDEGVSRRHARIRRLGPNEYEVEDLTSRNGTFLNGARVQRAELRSGDKIAVGEGTVFLFTRRDEFEDRLLQAQRLQALAQIAGGVGHDFNNLLGAVLTNVTHLRDLPEPDPAVLRSSLLEMEAAIRRTIGLTNQLLAFAHAQRPVMRAVDVSRLVEDVARIVRRSLARAVVLRTAIEPDLVVLGDSAQLLQAVLNLCMNAGEAMPAGGVLSLQAHREPGPDGGPDRLLLAVEDTGVGMDEVTQDRVFEPFFSTKPRGQGAGMGLANVYAIVRRHGGHVTLDPTGQRLSGPWPAVRPPPEGGVVLLVDDEELVRFALARVLEHAGLEVLTAGDGREALDLYARHRDRIGVVVLDLDMPVMDGEQAYRALRERDRRLSVLISSGFADPDRERALVDAGVVGILRKPYDASTLLRAVSTVLGRPHVVPEV
jgi:signal transduction histidine kinase